MKGGTGKIIPLYQEPVNTPFIPKVQKEIENAEIHPRKPLYEPPQEYPKYTAPGSKPLLDLQVYQPPKPKQAQPKISPAMYMPIPTQGVYTPPQYNSYWPYLPGGLQMTNPLVKQYNINNGPFVDYTTINVIKEDSLPSQLVHTSNTLGERINIHNFVRSVFIKHHDGEDIDLDGKGTNSLLSYLKFLELNPYNPSVHPENPYKGLPYDMVIYRSCYPIRYDSQSHSVQCAPNSIGMNIKIYKLSIAEYNIKKLSQNNYFDYDIWREVAYYEYIREQIIKPKVCPNFIMLYGYYVAEKCNIDFNKIRRLKGEYGDLPKSLTKDPQIIAPPPIQQSTVLGTGIGKVLVPTKPIQPLTLPQSQIVPSTIANLADQNKIILDENSGKGLVALTEAPTYNFISWASRTYKREGNIDRMVNTGYHKSEVWMSILFQLMVSLYVLQLHKIYITNFSIADNVYIKDIAEHSNVVTYWKYIINNYEFYVPNHGYLLMVDSNYKDTSDKQYSLIPLQNKKIFKIYSNMFTNNTFNDETIHNKCFENFKNIFNPNTFDSAFTNIGGTKPPDDIRELIMNIYKDTIEYDAKKDISVYIKKHMSRLLNNRTGTYLSEIEIKNVRKDDATPFHEGKIIVWEKQNETYMFVIYIGQSNNEGKTLVFTKADQKSKDLLPEEVETSALYNYSSHENIIQTYEPEKSNPSIDNLLETYVIG